MGIRFDERILPKRVFCTQLSGMWKEPYPSTGRFNIPHKVYVPILCRENLAAQERSANTA